MNTFENDNVLSKICGKSEFGGTYPPPCNPGIESMRYLVRQCPLNKQKEKSRKDSLKLAGTEKFSDTFDAILGKDNVSGIYGLEDEILQEAVFEALVEEEALFQLGRASNRYLNQLLQLNYWDCRVEFSLLPGGRISWSIYRVIFKEKQGNSLVDLLGNIFNISRLDALATLAAIVGMKYENIKQLSSEIHVAEERGTEPGTELIPEHLYLPRHQDSATRIALGKINGNSGQTIGGIVQYKIGEVSFCLPATVGKGNLSVGLYKPTAHFIDQDKMDAQPAAPIILCQDARVALAFHKIMDETRKSSEPDAIVTSHLFNDLSVLPWNYLHGHDVVFVPAPNKTCMAMVREYELFALGAGARSFKVATHILLHSKPGHDLNNPGNPALTDAETELVNKSLFIVDIENPHHLIRKILNSSIPYDEFVRRGTKNGIFKAKNQTSASEPQGKSTALKIFDPSAVAAVTQPCRITDVTLREILPSEGIIMIHGLKNAGKSSLTFELIKALVLGGDACGFPAEAPPAVVALMDSETPKGLLTARTNSYTLTASVNSAFFPLSKLELLASGEDKPVLTNETFRVRLETTVKENKAKYLILDNLTTLFGEGKIYSPQTAGVINDWAAELAVQGTTVIMLHHSNDAAAKHPEGAEMKGSREFSIRAHTEIVVIGREQILQNSKLGTEEVQACAKSGDGTTLGVHFKVCKMASVIEGHTFWFHLPLNDTATWIPLVITGRDGEPVNNPHVTSAPIAAHAVHEYLEDDSICADEEIKVLEHAQKNQTIVAATVRNLLSCAETKSREVLNGLVEKGKLIKLEEKQGMPTIYGLPE